MVAMQPATECDDTPFSCLGVAFCSGRPEGKLLARKLQARKKRVWSMLHDDDASVPMTPSHADKSAVFKKKSKRNAKCKKTEVSVLPSRRHDW